MIPPIIKHKELVIAESGLIALDNIFSYLSLLVMLTFLKNKNHLYHKWNASGVRCKDGKKESAFSLYVYDKHSRYL